MKIFEGKSPTEKKKIVAALVLGVMAFLALTYTFGGMFVGGKKTVTVNVSPTPTPTASPGGATQVTMPSQEQMDLEYATTPVDFQPGAVYAPDAGRNIFAFYEPPPPTPFSPTPLPSPTPFQTPPTPTPTPLAPQTIGFISPQSVYSGAKTFLLEVNGQGFTPDTRIVFNGSELPTTFVNEQRLTASVPSNFIVGEGQRMIETRTPDGKLFSYPVSMNVQAPPTPQFQYIGAKLASRANNDTAYFQEQGKEKPFSARLNDVIGGRFRVMSISVQEVVFEDVSLGFRHKMPLYRPAPGATASTTNPSNPPNYNPSVQPTYPNVQPVYPASNMDIPGIPNNIPRYNPNQNMNTTPPLQQQQQKQKIEDDDDTDN